MRVLWDDLNSRLRLSTAQLSVLRQAYKNWRAGRTIGYRIVTHPYESHLGSPSLWKSFCCISTSSVGRHPENWLPARKR